MGSPLEKEFKYFLDHKDELVEKYNGKYIVIFGGKVVGAHDVELEAIQAAQQEGYEPGKFLVQFISPDDNSYTQTFHSRVSFS